MTQETQDQDAPGVVSGAALRAKARQYITNPETGNTFYARRPTLEKVIEIGELPAALVAQIVTKPEDEEGEAAEPSDEEKKRAVLTFEHIRRAVVTAALLNPRVVKAPEADDECSYADILPSDRLYIHSWVKGTAPGATVATEGGAVAVKDLTGFPAGGRRGERAGAGDDAGDERAEPVGAVANT